MTIFLKNKLFILSLILFFGVFAYQQVSAVTPTLNPSPDADGCIGQNTVSVSADYWGCANEQKVAGIDGSSCNSLTCSGFSDGPHSFSAGCRGSDYIRMTDDVSAIIDSKPPIINSFSLKPVENQGSTAPDVIASNAKKLSGKITISVSATDEGVERGCGKLNVKIYIGKAGMEAASHAPQACGSYEKLNFDSTNQPNPRSDPNDPTGLSYEWIWNTTNVLDNRYYCLKAEAYDKFNHLTAVETLIIVNNKCDEDNDGYVNKEKFDVGCANVVCAPSDWLCLSTPDCNDKPEKGGYYAKPYSGSGEMDYVESLYSPKTYYYPKCLPPNGCPACDDLVDNDCDDSMDVSDPNCYKTCDQDGDNYYNTKCLRPENWVKMGDCNDSDKTINYAFKESFDNPACVKINCCMDGKDNDCDGQIDDCDFKKECDKDNDNWLSKDCSPDNSSTPVPSGYLGWGDCDDNDPNVYPGKKETEYVQGCNGTKDNNCDGTQDRKDLDCIDLCDKDLDGFFNFYDKNYKTIIGHNDTAISVCGGRFDQEQAPGSFTVRESGTGEIPEGKYVYKVTFVTPQGETSGSPPATIYITSSDSGNKNIKLDNIPTGSNNVTARRIYRTSVNGSDLKLLTTIPDNTTTTYLDKSTDNTLQTKRVPGSNSTGSTTIKTGGLGFDTMDVPDDRYPGVNPKDVNESKKERGWIYEKKIDTNGNDTVTDSAPKAGTSFLGGIVPCGRGYDDPNTPSNESSSCTICHFFYILERIVTFVRNLAFVVAPALIVVCGVIFIVSRGNPTMINRAKEGLLATLIGIVIILAAWVLVTLLFRTIGTQVEGGSWYEIQC